MRLFWTKKSKSEHFFDVANIHMGMGAHSQAIIEYQQAITLDPSNQTMWLQIIDTLDSRGLHDEAKQFEQKYNLATAVYGKKWQ
jgi:tetratricopeptide (TPR) repeat protein